MQAIEIINDDAVKVFNLDLVSKLANAPSPNETANKTPPYINTSVQAGRISVCTCSIVLMPRMNEASPARIMQ
jgi:hypothetical protein